MYPLTFAELRSLHAMAKHATTREAARSLDITEQTLRNEATSAYRKLGVGNKTAAFRKLGWLRPPRMSRKILIGVGSTL